MHFSIPQMPPVRLRRICRRCAFIAALHCVVSSASPIAAILPFHPANAPILCLASPFFPSCLPSSSLVPALPTVAVSQVLRPNIGFQPRKSSLSPPCSGDTRHLSLTFLTGSVPSLRFCANRFHHQHLSYSRALVSSTTCTCTMATQSGECGCGTVLVRPLQG